ncbi:MAG: hypothetical protein ABI765_09765 [Gemmatimonadota bacterium]
MPDWLSRCPANQVDLSSRPGFPQANNGGDGRRRLAGRNILFDDPEYCVHMIRHDNQCIKSNMRKCDRNTLPGIPDFETLFSQQNPASRYNCKTRPSVFRVESDEVRAVPGVVESG